MNILRNVISSPLASGRLYMRILFKKFKRKMSNENVDVIADVGDVGSSRTFTTIKEGQVEILFPKSQEVFYNPVQEFNRDVSVAVLRTFVKEWRNDVLKTNEKQSRSLRSETPEKHAAMNGVTILEALSASGLRAIRYAQEIPGVKRIFANDVSIQAVESIRRNVLYNKVEHIVEISHKDAALLMYEQRKPNMIFDVVDLDPYGSPTMFLDAAVQSVKDGGLLLVTCTDVAILCGNCSEKCHANYGAMSLKAKFGHEMALRIVLQSIESHANRYGRYIVPVLSLSVDFYVRVFVQVFSSHSSVKKSASKLGMVYMCTGCESFTIQPVGRCQSKPNESGLKFSNALGPPVESHCKHCGHTHYLGGPIWTDALHDNAFLEKILLDLEENSPKLNTLERIRGLLTMASEELPDVPLFYTLDKMCNVVHTRCPKMNQFRSALLHGGYRVSYSHCQPQSIKTDAPAEFMWDIMRHWAKLNPVGRHLSANEPANAILSKDPVATVSFSLHPDVEPDSKKNNVLRFQMNPEKNWGPKSRAHTSMPCDTNGSKSTRLQGKHNGKRPLTDFQKYQCKRFKKGECTLGEMCKYSHCLEDKEEPSNESV